MSCTEVAKILNVSRVTVYNHLNYKKIRIRSVYDGNRLRTQTEETKRKISKAQLGPKNSYWRGDKVKYIALHNWIRRNKPKPKFCEECGKVPPYDVANISNNYKRDINDYEWLCRRCHLIKDGRLKNLHKHNDSRGEKNPNAKLNNGQVIAIFRSDENGKVLAKRYDVLPGSIDKIRKGIYWKHITHSTH